METYIKEIKRRMSHNQSRNDSNINYKEIFKRLEKDVRVLEVEIQQLENISKESKELLGNMRKLLGRETVHTIVPGKKDIKELRNRVQHRKKNVQRLQRRLTNVGQNDTNEATGSFKNVYNSSNRSASSLSNQYQMEPLNEMPNPVDVSSSDELKLFEMISREIINKNAVASEMDLKILEQRRNTLKAEIEVCKTSEINDQLLAAKVMNEIVRAFDIQKEHMRQIDKESEKRKQILKNVKLRLYRMCLLLKTMNDGPLLDEHVSKEDIANILALMINKMKIALKKIENNKQKDDTTCNLAVAIVSSVLEEENDSTKLESIEENSQEDGNVDDEEDQYEDYDEEEEYEYL